MNKCPKCPYYEQKTSYGTEIVKCHNEKCKPMKIEYKSDNGYTGVLYGESSFSVYDESGKEVMHTGSRNINTYEELKEQVDEFPKFMAILEQRWDDLEDCDEDADI